MSENIPQGHVACAAEGCDDTYSYLEHGFGLCPRCRRQRQAEGGRRGSASKRAAAAPRDARIEELLKAGASYRAIAYEVDVSPSTVRYVALRLGLAGKPGERSVPA